MVRMSQATRKLLAGLLQGNRACLAKAITLVESKHPLHRVQSQWLLTEVLAHCRGRSNTYRIGLSGAPGAGKSTFIEHFGQKLIKMDHKVAVLAVDPSSTRSGGSILGDKTRMQKLAQSENVFIRPSPSKGALGGVTRSTNEVILLCEATGYDIILVETVGVGQSEVGVSNMVDVFVLLVPPAAGDELQGMKKGIVELADVVAITKADGDLLPAARRIQAEYTSAVKLMRPKREVWAPKVVQVSSITNHGMDDVWAVLEEFKECMIDTKVFDQQRRDQRAVWLWSHIEDRLLRRFKEDTLVSQKLSDIEKKVVEGLVTPFVGADNLLKDFFRKTQ